MYNLNITPSIGQTDALRHININSIASWFEAGRTPIFKIFNPTLDLTYKKWNLNIIHSEFNYLEHIYFGHDVEIRSYIVKIGKTSITVYQEAWQNNKLCANGNIILVYYDFIRENSKIIPEEIRLKLKEQLMDIEEIELKNKKEMKNK